MKKLLLPLLALVLLHVDVRAQSNKSNTGINGPAVDERVELTSIAARLAEYDEYNNDVNKLYVQDIHQYFDKYKDHPLIKYMREIRDANGIGFDAVATMAIHLSPPPSLTPIVKFSADVPDKRWGLATAMKFDTLLRQFYKDSHFDAFFKAHAQLYATAIMHFDSLYRQLDVNWYYKYYGIKPRGSFNIIIALGNGGANYGPKVIFPDGSEKLYAIMGAWKFNRDGSPSFNDRDYLPTLIHEFNHSFVNYLTDENKDKLTASGDIIYQADAKKMSRLAYGDWKTMMSEALVRASVIRYLQTHYQDTTVAEKEMQSQLAVGFVWIKKLVGLLGVYEANRQTYQTLEGFMPRIAEFYTSTAGNINTLISDYAKDLPHVASIEPAIQGDTTVDPGLKQIKVYFDKPLAGKGVSIGYGRSGESHYPSLKFLGYADGNKAILIQLDLKPNTDYEFVLLGLAFKTPDGHPLENYYISFKTRK